MAPLLFSTGFCCSFPPIHRDMKYTLKLLIAAVLLLPVTAIARNDNQPRNAIYTTVRLYEILDELKKGVKDSTTELQLKEEFVGLLKMYIGNNVNDSAYFASIGKYPNLQKMQNTVFSSTFKLEAVSRAVRLLMANATSETEKNKLKELDSLINKITGLQSGIIDTESGINTWQAKINQLQQIISHKDKLSPDETAQALAVLGSPGFTDNISAALKATLQSVTTQCQSPGADTTTCNRKLNTLNYLVNKTDGYSASDTLQMIELGVAVLNTDWVNKMNTTITTYTTTLTGLQSDIKQKREALAQWYTAFDNRLKQPDMTELKTKIIQTSSDAADVIKKAFSDPRSFISGIYGNTAAGPASITSIQTAITYSTSYQGHALSMPSQSEMIDAMAIFLANRVKQETITWFFEQLKKNAQTYADMNVLFPASMKLLSGNEIYETPDLGKAWRYAIAEDYINMPAHILQTSYVSNYFNTLPDKGEMIRTYIGTGISIATALQNRYTLSEMLDNLYLNSMSTQDKSLGGRDYIILLYAVKQELFLVDSNRRQWLSPSVLADMDDEMFMTLLSLTDIKYDRVFSRLAGKHLSANFTFSRDEVLKLKNWMAKILLNIKKLEAIYSELERTAGSDDNNKASVSYNVWTYTGNIIGTLVELDIVQAEEKAKVKAGLEMLNTVLDIYKEVDRKNYAAAVEKSMNIINRFYTSQLNGEVAIRAALAKIDADSLLKQAQKKKNKTDSAFKQRLKETFTAAIVDYKDYLVNVDSSIRMGKIICTNRVSGAAIMLDSLINRARFDRMRAVITKTGLFLTDVSDAKNSQDLSQVVEKYALPPSSYNLKKASLHSWFINAYVGPYLGYEWLAPTVAINAAANTSGFNNGLVYGITAPIGITYAHPPRRSQNKKGRFTETFNRKGEVCYLGTSPWSTTLSIVDIGAVVSYRISNTQDVLPQEFRWEQFISPGLHITKAIRNTPLVAGFSGVYTPLVRNIKNTDRQYSALRLQAGIYFDIPVLNVYAKNRYAKLDRYKL